MGAPTNWLELLQWNSSHLEELRFLGYIFFKEGHYEASEQFFAGLTLLEENNPYNYRMLAASFLSRGDSLKAIEQLDRALALEPSHLGTQLNKAKALFYLGRSEEARDLARALALCEVPAIANDAQALLLAYG